MTPKTTVKEIAEALDSELFNPPAAEVSDVTHDSRQAKPGTLFVAV